MEKRNSIFIATSIDGYIADENGGIDWLHSIPNPDNIDMGYGEFIVRTDAIIMGRKTFETVCSFDMEWPYQIPVFVLSSTLKEISEKLKDKVQLVKGTVKQVVNTIHNKGYDQLYIDGGVTIQGFLKEDLIDEMIITIIPVVLGGGAPLFADLPEKLNFECTKTELFLNQVVQNHYRRVREIKANQPHKDSSPLEPLHEQS